MARRAVVAELSCRMAGIGSAVIIGFMALPAVGVGQVVIAANVARLAGLCLVSAGEGKVRRAMIERRRLPCIECVALQAVVRELPGQVCGILRSVIIALVTLKAIGIG